MDRILPYKEIEVIGKDAKGKEMEYTINIFSIGYYRPYYDGNDKGKSMLFMQGSVKGMILSISRDDLKKLIAKKRQELVDELKKGS